MRARAPRGTGANVAIIGRSGSSVPRPFSESESQAHATISSSAGSRPAASAPARTSATRSARRIPAASPSASRRRRSRRRAEGARSRSPRRGSADRRRRGVKRSEHSSPHAYGPSLRRPSRRAAAPRTIATAARVRSTTSVASSPSHSTIEVVCRPSPSAARPPERRSSVARCVAISDGSVVYGFVPSVPTTTRSVALGDRGLDRPRVRHERVVRHPHLVDTRPLGGDREIDDLARRAEVLDEPNADLHRARRYRRRPLRKLRVRMDRAETDTSADLTPDLTPGLSVRDEFAIFEHTTYANSCSQGALANRVRAAAEEWLAGWDENGAEWEFWVERNEAARAAFAGLLHAEPDDVAVTTSVSQGVSALVSALDLSGERNRIVISEYEFPTVGPDRARPGAARRRGRPRSARARRPHPSGALCRRRRRADGARVLHGRVVPVGPSPRRERDRRGRACARCSRSRRQLPGDRRGRGRRAHARRRRRDRGHGQVPARLGRPRLHVAPARAPLRAPTDPDGLVRRRGHLRDVDRRLLAARHRATLRQRNAAGAVALPRRGGDGARR